MSARTKRMQRLAELTEKRERRSRRDLMEATQQHDAAEAALQSVFLQCRQIVEQPDAFSTRFGRGLIEAGWLAQEHHRAERDAAAVDVESRRSAWQQQRTRLDALGRLIDRLGEDETSQVDRAAEAELADLIAARLVAMQEARSNGIEVLA